MPSAFFAALHKDASIANSALGVLQKFWAKYEIIESAVFHEGGSAQCPLAASLVGNLSFPLDTLSRELVAMHCKPSDSSDSRVFCANVPWVQDEEAMIVAWAMVGGHMFFQVLTIRHQFDLYMTYESW